MDRCWFFLVLESDGCLKVKTIFLKDSIPERLDDVVKDKLSNFYLGSWMRTHISISVFVLFHELYPVKEASAVHVDRGGISQDFVSALQKMDLEDSLEEAHLLFQTNQLPLSTFTSVVSEATTRSSLTHFKPGTSSSTETYDIETTEESDLPISIAPSPLTLVTVFPPMSPTDSWGEPNNRDSVDVQSVPLQSLNLESNEEQTASHLPSKTDLQVSSVELTHAGDVSVKETGVNLSTHSSEVLEQSSSILSENTSLNHQASGSSTNTSQGLTRSCLVLDVPTKFPQPLADIHQVDHNSWLPTVKTQSENVHKKSSFRLCSGSSSSLDDADCYESVDSRKEFSNVLQSSSSSDSELEYKFDRQYSMKYNNLKISKSLKSVNTNSVLQTPNFLSTKRVVRPRMEHKRLRSEYINRFLNKESYIASSIPCDSNLFNIHELKDKVHEKNASSTCSSSAVSKRSDRHIRDIDVLEVAGVPFSYEDIVYSTNEQFRQLRATPGLTEEQLIAMSDARRRATNRQAAERCRRSKVAVRDELAERLAELRLQRQALNKRLIKARQRKQEARPSDWRVHLTAEDEIVVVSVGQ
uniref:Basic leucine zipper domain-containing protein n=1 Tax=Trichobilharzia regenti TaxID=157069 RepID=A0AA85IXF7_TRIRE|nr:unnamed protein product [Trichobilharzia regenti]